MGNYIRIKDAEGNDINEDKVREIKEYYHYIYDNATHELLRIERFLMNYKTGKIELWGGEVYLSSTDHPDEIMKKYIEAGFSERPWTFHYNKKVNSQGDIYWEYVSYRKEKIQDKGILVFDHKDRRLASCYLDWETGQMSNKRKLFYGDPAVLPHEFGDEKMAQITFTYHDDNSVREVFYYDEDYTLEEFLNQPDIMKKFPWDQYLYYHSFEPIYSF